MLQDGKGGLAELINQIHGSLDVEQVVVGDLLAMHLVEEALKVAVEVALLVGILAVAQGLLVAGAVAEGRALATVEVVEDGAVVV